MDRASADVMVVEFGRYTLLPHRRMLRADGRVIALGGRAIDILLALVAEPGAVLSHDDLLRCAWPGEVVEENNLQVQISALRKALGADRGLVRTVVGRGYQFIGLANTALDSAVAAAPPNNLPAPSSELIGRKAHLAEAGALLLANRLLTLSGSGGVGKTRLGLALARSLLPSFPDGVWWITLGPLAGPERLCASAAAALGLPAGAARSPEELAAALGKKQLLLVLDGCEHVVDAATCLVEAVLRHCPGARVLVTSRERLHSDGEAVYRVPALDLPGRHASRPEQAGEASAVQLFMARARGAEPQFAPGAADMALVEEICRRLDGIPLAIEFAAARAPTLGMQRLAAGLDDVLQLLAGGHRTALPRHRALRASLDWSYALLPQRERVVLRRLAIFPASFTLDAAIAMAGKGALHAADMDDCITSLASKSLLAVEAGGAQTRYRLLETTRAYGRGKLKDRGEYQPTAQLHAEYCCALLAAGAAPAQYGAMLDDVRAALAWAFGGQGSAALAAELAAAAMPMWLHLSLPEEGRRHVAQALALGEAGQDIDQNIDQNIDQGVGHDAGQGAGEDLGRHGGNDDRDDAAGRRVMRLQAGLGMTLFFAHGERAGAEPAWRQVMLRARALDDTGYRLRGMWGLWIGRLNEGDLAAGLEMARQFQCLAASAARPADALVGERLVGQSLHLLGDQVAARHHLERMLDGYCAPADGAHIDCYAFEQQTTARANLALVRWLQGDVERGADMARDSVEQARAGGHVLTLCHALASAACPIALLGANFDSLDRYVRLLLDNAARHGFGNWLAAGRFFKGMLMLGRGATGAGMHLLSSGLAELRLCGNGLQYTSCLGWYAQGLAGAGEPGLALAAIERALALVGQCKDCWGSAEMLRIKGELLWRLGGDGAAQAEWHFEQGLATARRHGALQWELRCATSLARLWREGGHCVQARYLLEPVYERFTEGFKQPDLVAARALLASLAG